mgnify:CR=1 FL=1
MKGNTITRAHLAEAVYQEVGLSRNESAELVDTVLDEVSHALVRGEQAGISTRSFPLEMFGDRKTRDLAVADWLGKHDVELVVLDEALDNECSDSSSISVRIVRAINTSFSITPFISTFRPTATLRKASTLVNPVIVVALVILIEWPDTLIAS